MQLWHFQVILLTKACTKYFYSCHFTLNISLTQWWMFFVEGSLRQSGIVGHERQTDEDPHWQCRTQTPRHWNDRNLNNEISPHNLDMARNVKRLCLVSAQARAGHVASRGGKSGHSDKPIFPQPLCLSKQTTQRRIRSSRKWSMPAPPMQAHATLTIVILAKASKLNLQSGPMLLIHLFIRHCSGRQYIWLWSRFIYVGLGRINHGRSMRCLDSLASRRGGIKMAFTGQQKRAWSFSRDARKRWGGKRIDDDPACCGFSSCCFFEIAFDDVGQEEASYSNGNNTKSIDRRQWQMVFYKCGTKPKF